MALAHPGRTAAGGAALHPSSGGLAEQVEVVLAAAGGGAIRLAALLGLKDETIALVTVDAAEACRAVAIVLKHAALEHIIVERDIGLAAVRRFDAKQAAQAVDEALRVGDLRPAGLSPMPHEVVDRHTIPRPCRSVLAGADGEGSAVWAGG
jgi:hypothetical protein